MHNHNDSNNSWMMWLMMACCLLPVLFVGFAGRGAGLPIWAVLGLAAAFIAFHFWGMRKSHSSVSQSDKEDKTGQDSSKNHSGHSCH